MDKLAMIRDLEYINGGIDVLKKLYIQKENGFMNLLEEWDVIINSLIDDLIEENDTETYYNQE